MNQNIIKSEGFLPIVQKLTVNAILLGLRTDLEKSHVFESASLAIPDMKKIEESLKVNNDDSESIATRQGLKAKKHREAIEGFLKPLISKANELHKGLTAFRNEKTQDLLRIEKALKVKIENYQAEMERQRLLKVATLEAAAKAKEEKLRQEALDKAAKWEAHGTETGAAKADEYREIAGTVHIPIIMLDKDDNVRSVDGGKAIGKRDTKIEIVNLLALVREIAEGRAPIGCVKIMEGVLGAYINAMDIKEMPGVRIQRKKSVSFSTKK